MVVTPASPLRAVLDALTAGEPTLDAVARRTGLPGDVVRAAVDQLIRLGRVETSSLSLGCAPGPDGGGCGSCPSGGDPAGGGGRSTGCGAGPALVTLSVRRR